MWLSIRNYPEDHKQSSYNNISVTRRWRIDDQTE